MKKLLTAFLFLLCVQKVIAQDYSSGNPAAIRAYEQALNFYDKRLNEKAIEALKTAIEKDSSFIEAYMLLGNINEDMKKYDEALINYRMAIEKRPDFFPNNYFALGSVQYKKSMYSEAKASFEKFLTYPKITSGL